MTLKPAQCALWLRAPKERKNIFFRAFNVVYRLVERMYAAIIRVLVRHVVTGMLVFFSLLALSIWWYTRVPTGFLPLEDQGYMFVAVQLPDAASQERTRSRDARD